MAAALGDSSAREKAAPSPGPASIMSKAVNLRSMRDIAACATASARLRDFDGRFTLPEMATRWGLRSGIGIPLMNVYKNSRRNREGTNHPCRFSSRPQKAFSQLAAN